MRHITVIILLWFFLSSAILVAKGREQDLLRTEKKVESECRTSRFPILMYHHIRESGDKNPAADHISVTPEEFEAQMRHLHEKGWRSITTDDIRNQKVPCNAFMISFDDGYHDAYKNAFPILEKYGYTAIVSLIPAYIDESDYLSGKEIDILQHNGWEIASHSWHHPILTRTPIKQLHHEIWTSKKDLEKWFQKGIRVFVYPGGFYGPKTVEQAEASGYVYAFTTRFGFADLSGHLLGLQRIDIPPGTDVQKLDNILERAKNID